MTTTPITTSTAVSLTTNTDTVTTVLLPAVTGHSTVSTITSATHSSGIGGFSTTLRSWISTVLDAIRNCFSRFPIIGPWLASSPTPLPPVVPPATTIISDADYVRMIKNVFVEVPASATATAAPVVVPGDDVVAYVLDCFNHIHDVEPKMQAFQAILTAPNSTDVHARQFYDALNETAQTAFRAQIYTANGNSDVDTDGVSYGIHFGEHIIDRDIKGPLAQQAIGSCLVNLRAAASVSSVVAPPSSI